VVGYIISINKCKDEDLIVRVLTASKIYTLYRFYGARHSTINLGYKIDFNTEKQGVYMPRLRNILHLGYDWLFDAKKVFFWQEFIKLLSKHLFDVEEIGCGYFEALENLAKKIKTQDAQRAIIETYTKILELEGRLNSGLKCFICNQKINEQIGLNRAFLPSHPNCTPSNVYLAQNEVKDLFENKKTIFLSDELCSKLFKLIKQGL